VTRSVTTPGWQVTSLAGQVPAVAIRTPRGGLTADKRRLEGKSPNQGQRPGDGAADRTARTSGFAASNSGQGPNARGPIQGAPPQGAGPRPGDRLGLPFDPMGRGLPPTPADPPR